MLKKIFRYLLGRPFILNGLKAIYLHFFQEISALRNANPDVREITPMGISASDFADTRFTMLLPGISERHTFGGISTALEFLEGFKHLSPHLRVVVTDESVLPKGEEARFPGWRITTLNDSDSTGHCLVLAEDRQAARLAVSVNDVFIGTAWWTANLAKSLVRQQAELHGISPRPFIYLIQDFEPGFYPWSARYALADATYRNTHGFVPVFNTQLLKAYFESTGYQVEDGLWFNPVLNQGIRSALQGAPIERQKRVLVYGRPTVERNAFPLIVMGLRHLIAHHAVRDWIFVSAGEAHAPVDLGGGCVLHSLGKLSLENYALELKRCHVGLSLMISPHPSYPPLEMAACGMRVVTNHYGPKDLSTWSNSIRSVATPNPESIGEAMAAAMAEFDGTGAPQGRASAAFDAYLNGHLGFTELAQQACARTNAA